MDPEDLYPNDGGVFYPRVPADQSTENKKEKAKAMAGLAILKDIISRFDERIDFYYSVDSIPNEAKDDPEKFMHRFTANQLTRDNLIAEKEYLESLIE